jgi:competence protein CoiA
MQYSLVNGERIEAHPNLVGRCICCNKPTYSACGKIFAWHWRHKNKRHCDAGWEPETNWHREWKSRFPEEWREIIHYDTETNEKHIADIKTDKGVIIEFQNSPISFDELTSPEQFYKTLVWVVNGISFKINFEFGCKLPNPSSQFPQGYKFLGHRHWLAYDSTKDEDLVQILHKIQGVPLDKIVEKYHTRHYAFDWKKARQVWFQATMPILIDFNDGILWRILPNTRLSNNPICCCYSQKEFISHYNCR